MKDVLNLGFVTGGSRRRLLRSAAGGALGLAALVGLSACNGEEDDEEEGLDEAGGELDEAGDGIEGGIDEAGDEIEGGIDEAGGEIEEAGDTVVEEVDEN